METWSSGMLQILIPNYTINHCTTESSTALDSEDERGNMARTTRDVQQDSSILASQNVDNKTTIDEDLLSRLR